MKESLSSLSVDWSFQCRVNRDSKLISPPIIFGTLEWRIIFYPRAKSSPENVSLYLELLSQVNTEFKYSLSFSFTIPNSNPLKTKNRTSSHVFKRIHDNWGFHKFMSRFELFDYNHGYISPDQTLTIHTVFQRPKFPEFTSFQCISLSHMDVNDEIFSQPMFHCYSCSPGSNEKIFCLPCISRCHAGHFVGPLSISNSICACTISPRPCKCTAPVPLRLLQESNSTSSSSTNDPSPSSSSLPTVQQNRNQTQLLKIKRNEIDIDLLASDINELPNISCSICTFLVLSDDGVLSSCCETPFHSNCLKEWMKRQKSCPNCRKQNIPFIPVSRLYKHIISKLQFKCPIAKLGCSFTGRLDELLNHSEKCTFALAGCPHCGIRYPKSDLKKHVPDCKFRIITCPNNCGANVKNGDLMFHCEICPNTVTICPNSKYGCTEKSVPRRLLPAHMISCKFSQTICPMNKFGCTWSGPSSEKDTHTSSCHLYQSRHSLLLLDSKLEKATQERNKMMKSLENINQVIYNLNNTNSQGWKTKQRHPLPSRTHTNSNWTPSSFDNSNSMDWGTNSPSTSDYGSYEL